MQKPKRSRSRQKPAAPRRLCKPRVKPPQLALTIAQFCQAYGGFSPAMFFKLKKLGLGPREMRIGRRVMISMQSAEAWRREREEAAA
jgi:hypothetical protein